ncbi:hypothetical protein DMUE_1233 [Dictyocoela muelleri]|nr:hypothetical protein DMUE_1233 [Dictyocoela muelleri]
MSIRVNSFFEGFKLDFKTIFVIFYKYLNGISYVDIAYKLDVYRNTVIDYCGAIRAVICDYISDTNELIGGYNTNGPSKIVEIDESIFFKRKYNSGQLRNGQ